MQKESVPFAPGSAWISPELRARLQTEGTTAHRLATTAEGWVEALGEDVLISHKHEAALARFQSELTAWCTRAGWAPRRVWSKFLALQNADRIAPKLLEGDATLPPRGEASEAGVRFGLDFEAGYSAGFFIDQRANRAKVREWQPQRLLNTFAYTCSFSVVSAMGGSTTCSVDLSKKSLDRGRENFALNGLDDAKHQFIADDVMEVLPRLVRRKEQYDCIILDPPTFSRNAKGRKWQVEEHMQDLLAAALEVAAPKANILISTNCTRLKKPQLEALAKHGLRLARRNGSLEGTAPLPDIPASSAAQTVWLRLR